MAYQTGTAATPAALQTIIETFALANGYTGTAGGILTASSNSDSNIQLKTIIPNILSATSTGYVITLSAYGASTTLYADFSIGQTVVLSGFSPSSFNGTFTITALAGNIITLSTNSTSYDGSSTVNGVVSGSLNALSITGFTSSAGANPSNTRFIYLPAGNFPVTYYLFGNSSPTLIHCAINYNVSLMQHMTFGSYVPISSSAFVGSSFSFASYFCSSNNYSYYYSYPPSLTITNNTFASIVGWYAYAGYPAECVLGSTCSGSTNSKQLHAEIDGSIWAQTNSSGYSYPVFTDQTIASIYYSPNSWNNQAILVPMHLQLFTSNSATLYHYLGYIEHLRLIRIDNYNLGDIITLGSDQWMVFPIGKKDTVNRNGTSATPNCSTGTVGYAIRKT